jgi:hypothetical protein
VENYWAYAGALPLGIYLAGRVFAGCTTKQSLGGSLAALLWCAVMWGLLAQQYVHEYHRSPFSFARQSQLQD